jgi:hypothetical protein
MEDSNSKVIERLDRIIEIQSSILYLLNKEKHELNNNSTKRKAKLSLPDVADVDYWLTNRQYLKNKFKLVATPQFDICVLYKKTGDGSIFDQFKKIK